MKTKTYFRNLLLTIPLLLSTILIYPGAILAQSTNTGFTPIYTNSRWSEDTMRSYMAQYGISENGNVTLYGLGNFAVTGIVSLKRTVDYYTAVVRGPSVALSNIVIVGGTETYGVDTPVLDVHSDPALDFFITALATLRTSSTGGTLYQLGDDYLFQQNGYWHIIFGPSNGAFVKNTIPFYGIVRDNFNVAHPTLTSANVPSSIAFNHTLYLGATGQDVHDLQELLNTDPYTQVAASGPGSPGNETSYFGSKTKTAVNAYQYKNNEILDAAGVTAPTGLVASFSRAHLTAYWNYLNTNFRKTANAAVLQYPTPTKPLQDIPLNATTTLPVAGTSVTATTTITVNTTPNAPIYSGDINSLPTQQGGADNPNQLNNNPVFDTPPVVNGSNVTDPNNAANQSSAKQPSLLQSLLPTILKTLQGFTGGGGGSGLGGGGASAGTNFGGVTSFSSISLGDPNAPCMCGPIKNYIINNNTAVGGGAVYLLDPSNTLTKGICAVGKYTPGPAIASCMSLYHINGSVICKQGTGDVYPVPPPIGIVTKVERMCTNGH